MLRALRAEYLAVVVAACHSGSPAVADAPPSDTSPVVVDAPPARLMGTETYYKGQPILIDDRLGTSIALSQDGLSLAIGHPNPTLGGKADVYLRSGGQWIPRASFEGIYNTPNDLAGAAVAISADGTTLAMGAPGEASCATGIGGDQQNTACGAAGAVFMFVSNGGDWVGNGYIKASNTASSQAFGTTVALSADGNTLAVGSPGDASDATGIDGDAGNQNAQNAGAVFVFSRSGTTWSQQAYVKSSNAEAADVFGNSVALSGDGATLAVGAPGEASAATGVNGSQADNSKRSSGAVFVFARTGTTWQQRAYVKASNTDQGDQFGGTVALAASGTTLVAGAAMEASNATGVGGDPSDNTRLGAGAAYVFAEQGTTWSQQAYLKGIAGAESPLFGSSLAIDAAGDTILVGAPMDSSGNVGLDAPPIAPTGPENGNSSGAVHAFHKSGGAWSTYSYIKATHNGADDAFGTAVTISGAGDVLAIGAPGEDSSTGADQEDNSAKNSGAVYLIQ